MTMQMVTMIIPLKIMHVHMGSAAHSHTFPDQPFVTGSCHSRSPASDIGDPGIILIWSLLSPLRFQPHFLGTNEIKGNMTNAVCKWRCYMIYTKKNMCWLINKRITWTHNFDRTPQFWTLRYRYKFPPFNVSYTNAISWDRHDPAVPNSYTMAMLSVQQCHTSIINAYHHCPCMECINCRGGS